MGRSTAMEKHKNVITWIGEAGRSRGWQIEDFPVPRELWQT